MRYGQRMAAGDARGLANEEVQLMLLAEAAASASVGILVWDEDRRYVAANARACELLGSVVGERTVDGSETVERVVRNQGGHGAITASRFDGPEITLGYFTFETRTADLSYKASVIWPADETRA